MTIFERDHMERMGGECECTDVDTTCLLNDAEFYASWRYTEDYAENRSIIDSAIRCEQKLRK